MWWGGRWCRHKPTHTNHVSHPQTIFPNYQPSFPTTNQLSYQQTNHLLPTFPTTALDTHLLFSRRREFVAGSSSLTFKFQSHIFPTSGIPTIPPLLYWHSPTISTTPRGVRKAFPLMSIIGLLQVRQGHSKRSLGRGILGKWHLVREIPRLPNRLKPSCSQEQGQIKGRIQTSTTYATKNRTMLNYHRFLQGKT